jgi:hypothetical protein
MDRFTAQAQPAQWFEPITYIGVQDFRYWVMEYAGMKTGHPILLFSPRNSLINNASLFQSCGCKTLVYSSGLEALAQQHKNAIPGLATFEIASSDELFDVYSKRREVVKPYPYRNLGGSSCRSSSHPAYFWVDQSSQTHHFESRIHRSIG